MDFWYLLIILALGQQRQEDYNVKASLGNPDSL